MKGNQIAMSHLVAFLGKPLCELSHRRIADGVLASNMLAELCEDNKTIVARLREAHNVCEDHKDIATTSMIEVWIDETERRAWFLFEAGRPVDATGR